MTCNDEFFFSGLNLLPVLKNIRYVIVSKSVIFNSIFFTQWSWWLLKFKRLRATFWTVVLVDCVLSQIELCQVISLTYKTCLIHVGKVTKTVFVCWRVSTFNDSVRFHLSNRMKNLNLNNKKSWISGTMCSWDRTIQQNFWWTRNETSKLAFHLQYKFNDNSIIGVI